MLDGSNTWRLAAALSTAVASGAIAGMALSELRKKEKEKAPQKWIRVGTVSELILYPVKSCQGVRVNEATTTIVGLKASDFLRDRVFMVVDSRWVFQTQRTIPKMALIHVAINGNQLSLSAPDTTHVVIDIPEDNPTTRKSCRIFDDRVSEALDCGDEVGKWLDGFLEKDGLRIVYHKLEHTQRSMTGLQKKFPGFVPSHKGTFQDQTSYMLMAEESVAELNNHLEKPVTYKNFRPSIMIKGIPEVFAEDQWTFVRIGRDNGPILKSSKPCTRCKLTTVNPATGEFDSKGEPLSTLTTLKRKYGDNRIDDLVKNQAVLGVQLGLFEGADSSIKVGDPVYAAVL